MKLPMLAQVTGAVINVVLDLLLIFGVGGLPSYDSGDYYRAVGRGTALGKTVVMTTQVTNEGSNMSV